MFENLNRSFLASTQLSQLKEIPSQNPDLCFSSQFKTISLAWWFYLLSHDTNELPFSLRRSIRGKIRPHNTEQSSYSLLCATVTANQAIWSLVCFNWVSNNRWVINNSPMDTMCSRSVLQMDDIICLYWMNQYRVPPCWGNDNYFAITFLKLKANPWECQQSDFLIYIFIIFSSIWAVRNPKSLNLIG